MTNYRNKGFTLIELLIVMAILGVLAVVVLVAINPAQQLARTRDAGRKSSVTQLGHSLEAYYTSHSGEYLDASNCLLADGGPLLSAWIGCLVFAGEMSSVPTEIANSVGHVDNVHCSTLAVDAPLEGEQNEYCYVVNGTSSAAIIWTVLESQTEESKCPVTQTPNFIWNTTDGRGGTVCLDDDTQPSVGTYVGDYEED